MQTFKGLYALCDYNTLQSRQISLAYFSEIIYEYPTFYIQYRDKINDLSIQIENIKELKRLCGDIPIIINDHFDLLCVADGLHLGQEDLEDFISKNNLKTKNEAVEFIREQYPNKTIGLSTHSLDEVEEANQLALDYIGLGAYRNTSTKDVAYLLGEDLAYIALHSKHPVAAIGGVKIDDRIENVTYNVVGSGLYDN